MTVIGPDLHLNGHNGLPGDLISSQIETCVSVSFRGEKSKL